jgi:large subunit ribosomal protein L3
MLYTLIGKKLGMTQIYDGNNSLIPVTVVEAGPCCVVQVKTEESDGYNAIQIGFGTRKASRLSNAQRGHFKRARVDPARRLREVRFAGKPDTKVGEVFTIEGFFEGQKVDVIGLTKGRGFQGVVRRFGFSGGPASHGSMMHRRGGSYGQCQWPGEVYKGRKMPGRMGGGRRTVQNLSVVKVLSDKNLILLRGSVPGAEGSELILRAAKKARKTA